MAFWSGVVRVGFAGCALTLFVVVATAASVPPAGAPSTDWTFATRAAARASDFPAGWHSARFPVLGVCGRLDPSKPSAIRYFRSDRGYAPGYAVAQVSVFAAATDAAAASAQLNDPRCFTTWLRQQQYVTKVETSTYELPGVHTRAWSYSFLVTGPMNMGSYSLGPGSTVVHVAAILSGRALVVLNDNEAIEEAMRPEQEAKAVLRILSRLPASVTFQ